MHSLNSVVPSEHNDMTKIYTGVGSRKAPKHICTLMRLAGFKLASDGWCLRSGAAPGPDDEFYLGAMDWYATQIPSEVKHCVAEIYLPWNGFENKWHNDPSGHFINYQFLDGCAKALEIASQVHPNWEACKKGGSYHMHGRNAMQILGAELDLPSQAVFCYAKESSAGVVSGGTATAVNIGKANNVPIKNLFFQDVYEAVLRYVGITEERLFALSGITGV